MSGYNWFKVASVVRPGGYDIMKGWGPVSISVGLLFPYHKKWNRSLKPPLITIVELQILNSYKKKCLWRKKQHYHHYHHHHHHHLHHHCCHYHQFHHHQHSLSAPPGANPVWGPLGWRKQIIIIIIIIVIIIFIIIIIIITIDIVFLPPMVPIVFKVLWE